MSEKQTRRLKVDEKLETPIFCLRPGREYELELDDETFDDLVARGATPLAAEAAITPAKAKARKTKTPLETATDE